MAKKRVFVSYDFDNDKALKEFIIGQAKNDDSPFEVIDASLREEAPQAQWEQRARAAISRADVFIVMLGSKSRSAPGVLKEVQFANDLQKPKFQLIGYQGAVPTGRCPTRAASTPGIGKISRSFSVEHRVGGGWRMKLVTTGRS